MAHDEDDAFIFAETVLQHVERLEVEIIRRLVEDEDVGRLGEGTRQHQSAALAARKRVKRRARLLGREQEVLQIADDMTRLAPDR